MRKEKGMMSGTKLWTGSIVAALLAAIAVFAVMLQMEQHMLSQYEKTEVFVACREIPKGQTVTQKNWQEYLIQKEMDKACIPDSAIGDVSQIQELSAVFDIEEGVVLTEGMFEPMEKVIEEMKEPVIVGFKADDLYQVVGGTLRPGDRIHIYQIDEFGEAGLVWENVFVQQVFDYSGTQISCEDALTGAQRINVYLDRDKVEMFYSKLAGGSLCAVKIIQ